MIESLINFDTNLFLLINGMHSAYFDNFMYFFSGKSVWFPFYLSLIVALIIYRKKQSFWIILALILCIVIADQIASGFFKEWVKRLRPSHNESLSDVIHLVNNYKSGLYGFVSSHAANTFGIALLSSLIFKNKLYSISVFSWAIITSYSRVYLGVHYPFDVVGGMFVGFFSAIVLFILLQKIEFFQYENKGIPALIPNIVLGISVIGIVVFSLII